MECYDLERERERCGEKKGKVHVRDVRVKVKGRKDGDVIEGLGMGVLLDGDTCEFFRGVLVTWFSEFVFCRYCFFFLFWCLLVLFI